MPTAPVLALRAKPLEHLLIDFPDNDFILSGLRDGFSLSPSHLPTTVPAPLPRRRFSTVHRRAIQKLIAEELSERRIAGPFAQVPFKYYIEHPIFLVAKPDSKVPWRLIHDLSKPAGSSLNDLIPRIAREVKYPTVDLAVENILRLHSDVFLAKTDLASAFRNLAVRPDQFCLLVFAVENAYYVDLRLPFGAGSSCRIFQRFSNGLAHIVATACPSVVVLVYLDDFLFIGPTYETVDRAQAFFHDLCGQINLPINYDKTVRPCFCLKYLGVVLDTRRREVRLGQEKLQKLRTHIDFVLRQTTVTKLHCQRMVGLLQWAARVIRPGRTFLRRLIDLGTTVTAPHERVKITPAVCDDLLLWKTFLDAYNGIAFMSYRVVPPDKSILFASDAAGNHGFAALLPPSWAMATWPAALKHLPIHIKEILAVYLGLFLWHLRLRNTKFEVLCDNMAVVQGLNKMTARDPRLMFFLRKIVLLCLQHNILITARYISSTSNRMADLLSRGRSAQFLREFPNFDSTPTSIPPSFFSSLASLH